jgi:hypothetical protein
MVSALIQLPFGLSHRTPDSERLAWAAPGLHAKRELMKLCARIGYTPH